MQDLFAPSLPWWQFPLRSILVYVMLLTLLRLAGRRTVAQFTAFDLAVIVLAGAVLRRALTGDDESLTGGVLVVGTLVAMNRLIAFFSTRSRRFDRLIEGSPVLLARDGKVYDDALRHCNIPSSDFEHALRKAGLTDAAGVHLAVLEPNGEISVLKR